MASPPRQSARRDRRRPRRRSGTTCAGCASSVGAQDAHRRRSADGRWSRPTATGTGCCRSARAARAARGATGSASPPLDEALALRDGRRHRAGCSAGWRCPGDGLRRRWSSADVDVTAYSAGRARRDRAAAPRGRRGRPGAAQDRHRAVPRRLRPATTGRRWSRPPGRREDDGARPGHRHLVALRLHRRARPPRQRRAGGGLRGGARASPTTPGSSPRSATWPTRPRALLRPSSRLRPGPRAASRPTASTRRPTSSRTDELGLVPGDDGARPARAGQASSRPAPASPTATPAIAERADARSALVPAGVRRRRPAARRATRAEVLRRRQRAAAIRGADLHGPVRGRPRRRRGRTPATRSCCSAPGPTASRPRTDWAEAVRDHRLRDRHPDRWPRQTPRRRRRRGGRTE